MSEIPPIFTVSSPSEWQPAPEWMNVHYFFRAEKCPRSAALRYSRYAALWDKNGYPDKPGIATLAGTVVHAAIANIVRRFTENGCRSIHDPRCFAVLKQLGGYSQVLRDIMSRLLESLTGNPRFDLIRESVLASLQSRIPALREQLQLDLSEISWPLESVHDGPGGPQCRKGQSKESLRLPLQQGVHFEVEVRDPSLMWKGVIDLLDVGKTECAIADFKTGAPSEDHVLQLQLYALLWLHDRGLNPNAVPASRLSLCYPSGEKHVNSSPSDLMQIGESLGSRGAKVRSSISGATSRANVNAENCRMCDVRHLCSEYWTSNRPVRPISDGALSLTLDDIELVLKTRKGEKTWLAECQISSRYKAKASVLLRWSTRNFVILEALEAETRVRLVDAIVSSAADSDVPIINCTNYTDLLVLGATE